ncbi:HD domain-containing protein [Desulfobotulus alkaliphilus]|uniref:HD domain-containing protein n=1 Tax=Desulfobotulus alkaliphilus TaxID=622671 RepID=A0A562RTZ0_9BACT|nr:HD domain-containing phosphohydrolase [Desulfobotulus alkaliphilus]TWI71806.1 HD domain-containing protein [Desulfobotulus alkaliphilus]
MQDISEERKKNEALQGELAKAKQAFGKLKEKYLRLSRSLVQAQGLLENALERNRLLLEERSSLREEVRIFRKRRRVSIENTVSLLVFLQELHMGEDGGFVEDLCHALALALNLDKRQQWRLHQASRLYRLGLFHVPEEHRQRVDLCYTATAADCMVQVPLASARMLEQMDGLSEVARILRCTGERWDGSGGPLCLKKKAIPLESRMLSAVLAYRAMLQEGTSSGDALSALGREAAWDPEVIEALRVFESDSIKQKRESLRIRIWDLEPGMKLAAPVHARAGAMLLPEGTLVTQRHLAWLAAYSGAGPLDDMVRVYKEELEKAGGNLL